MKTDSSPRTEPGAFRALSPLVATVSMTFMGSVATSVWIPVYARIFQVTPAVIGLIGSVQLVMSALVMLFLAPRLLRRLQPRTLMIAGLAALIAAELLTVLFDPGRVLFTCLRALEGASIGLATAATGVLASFTKNPTRTFGVLQLAQGVAITVLFGFTGLILSHFGIRGIFALVGLGALAATPFALATPKIELSRLRPAEGMSSASPTAAFPIFGFLTLAAIFLVNVGTSTHMGDFGSRIGMSVASVSVVLAVSGSLSIVSSAVVTLLAGRAPPWAILAVAAVIASAGLFGLGVARTPPELMLAACAMLFGNTLGAPVVIAIVSASDSTGRAASAAQAAIMAGTALGPAGGGAIETFLSLRALSVIFAVIIPLALLTAGLISLRRQPVTASPGLPRVHPAPPEALRG